MNQHHLQSNTPPVHRRGGDSPPRRAAPRPRATKARHPRSSLLAKQQGLPLGETLANRGPRLTVLSFGGGQDSTAILLMLLHDEAFRRKYAPHELVVVMSDTGDEHAETYQHVEHARELCRKHGLPFVFLTPDLGYHGRTWSSLIEHYRLTRTVGSKAYPKTCTHQLKIGPIYKWLEAYVGERYGVRVGAKQGLRRFARRHGRIRVLLGIGADEAKRRIDKKPDRQAWMRDAIEKVYPLVDLGMDRAACQQKIRDLGERVPPPSNCMRCPFLSEIELVWLYRTHPDKLREWMDLEHDKVEAWKERLPPERNLGVWGRRLLPEVLEGALAKYGHLTAEELTAYKMSHGHCVSSTY